MPLSAADPALSPELVELVARRFAALGDPTRVRLLDTLRMRGELSVAELAEALDAGYANVAKHLTVLHHQRVVAREKHGTKAIYRISDPSVLRLCEEVCGALHQQLRELEALVAGARSGCPALPSAHDDLSPDHPRRPRLRLLPDRRRRRRRGRGRRPEARDRRVPRAGPLHGRVDRAHPRDPQPRRPRVRPRPPRRGDRRDDPHPPRRRRRLRPRAVRRRLGARARQRCASARCTRPATGPSTPRSR